MNLKVPGATLPLGFAILSTRARTVRGVGTTPLRRTRVNGTFLTRPCHKIYTVEAVGLKKFQLYFKNYDFCENLKFGAIL